jgi:hypothetical protein
VLRHFESRARLLDATVEFGAAVILAERATPVGDADTAVRTIVDHYELRGDLMIRLLAQEDDPRIASVVGRGRDEHRTWVESTFTAFRDTPEILDLLLVATDVFTWKLLRRDRNLNREATEQRMLRLVHALLESH